MGRRPEVAHVEMLGEFRVTVGSRVVGEDAWRLRKAAALVKLLALEPKAKGLGAVPDLGDRRVEEEVEEPVGRDPGPALRALQLVQVGGPPEE